MDYTRKTVDRWKYYTSMSFNVIIGSAMIAANINFHLQAKAQEELKVTINKQQKKEVSIAHQWRGFNYVMEKEVVKQPQTIDFWVGKYVDQYYKTPAQQSEMRMVMHCLLNRESKHGIDKGHGDNGKAGGPLQFWEGTWDRMRGQMMKQGLIEEIGSRYDTEQAIHTTVWAFKNGNGLEWGPALRWSKGKAYQHACPTPTGY